MLARAKQPCGGTTVHASCAQFPITAIREIKVLRRLSDCKGIVQLLDVACQPGQTFARGRVQSPSESERGRWTNRSAASESWTCRT